MKKNTMTAIIILVCIVSGSSLYYVLKGESKDEIVLATTTSTYDSGLLDEIIGDFERSYNIRVKIIAVGTGQALKLGENGDADVLLIHALSKEKTFVENGHGLFRRNVMYNKFVIVGPSEDPANISGMDNLSETMASIHDTESTFTSRGDDSGTHTKEIELWETAGFDYDTISNQENSEWYLSLGQGMGDTLRTASEMQGYTITDEGTYYSMKDELDLEIVFKGDPLLFNQYGVIPVNSTRYDGVNEQGALDFSSWIISPEVQGMIDGYFRGGKQLFTANGGE